MSNLAEQLLESASAVAALGVEAGDIAALDDASVVGGLALVTEHRRNLQAYEVLLAAQISARSSHEFGNSGLARRNGAATPAVFIQTITGSSTDEATKLARLGGMVIDAQLGGSAEQGDAQGDEQGVAQGTPEGIGQSSAQGDGSVLATAAVSGEISIAAADAIRKGLGRPDDVVTSEQLESAARELLAQAGKISPEELLKLARIARNHLDLAAVAAGQRHRSDLRYVRRWRRDGMSGGSWSLPDEDGGADIDNALKLLLASRTSRPRFPETDANGDEVIKTAAQIAQQDPRSFEQVLADGFAQIMINGLRVDPSVVPSAGRVPVRVMVSEQALRDERGSALLEDSLSAITFEKLEEYLCEGGSVGVLFDDKGQAIDVGREQRLFTAHQRTGLGVRDGGCRYPGCDKPPSWCEAHHILQWVRDRGKTDITNGILLCRYHHMHIHDSGAEIIREGGTYWLKPGKSVDQMQTLIEMPSKNPLVAAMNLERTLQQVSTA
jgi:Domain of unknown function (DUF222)